MLRAARRELLDGPVESVNELEENFSDIERANRYLGGLSAIEAAIAEIDPQSVLDVGCGSADVARELVRAARSRGCNLRMVCLDANPQVLSIARRSAADSSMEFVLGDGLRLPFEDASFDVAMCNLTLHHCDPDAALTLLRELRRVSRRSPLVTDLRRSRAAWLGAKLLTVLFTRNRLTRHDAPLSVLRAYSPAEALHLAHRAGWKKPRVRATRFFRMILTDA